MSELKKQPRTTDELLRLLEDEHTFVTLEGEGDALDTEMVINMGPSHPATHGVLRVVLKMNGETITRAIPELGYLHRAMEKLAENKSYHEFMPYTDRLDYMMPYSNNVAWCLAVEKAAGIEVPERAQVIRTLACELARISSHLLWLGSMVMDTGALTLFLHTFREREKIYDIFDLLTGARFTVSHSRIGGLASDLSPEALTALKSFIKQFPAHVQSWEKLLNRNKIFLQRTVGIGYIDGDLAVDMGLTGPNLRGSGVEWDLRKKMPYLKYADLQFDIPTSADGDSFSRYWVRMQEFYESVRIIEQCLDKLAPGPVRVDFAKQVYPWKSEVYHTMEGLIHDFMLTDWGVCPEPGQVYQAIETSKGELGFYIQSDGTGHPWRMKIRSPSFVNLQSLPYLLEGSQMADTVVIIGSLDPVMGEADK
ncbi:MAG: NADH dehydrogenase (quinone) subunit D [Bacteroidetes bacterium]|nr:NADH dehydrogenase (quinone) subunit D [Bacteroidota bacterium]